MAHNFIRPQLPYINQSLANDDRYRVLTRADKAPPPDIMLDSDFNAIIDYLNILDVDMGGIVAGSLPGINDINNANFMLSTDGEGHAPWKLVEGINVKVNSVGGNRLIDSSVTGQQIQNGTIKIEKMAPESVGTTNLVDLSVNTAKLANDAVTTLKILDANVTTAKLEDNAVTTAKIADANVTTDKILDANVTLAKLAQDVLDRLIPIGTVVEFAGSTGFAANWLECTGQAVSRATYATLFANLGTIYGVGDGATTFNLPDRRGRVSVGIGSDNSTGGRITNATAANITLGETGVFGFETHTLTTPQIPSHTHGLAWSNNGLSAFTGTNMSTINNINSNVQTTATGGGLPHNNTQPSIFTRYYIRAL